MSDARPLFILLLLYSIFSSGAETQVGGRGQSVSIKAKRNGTCLRNVDATGNRSGETTTEQTVMRVEIKKGRAVGNFDLRRANNSLSVRTPLAPFINVINCICMRCTKDDVVGRVRSKDEGRRR